VHKKAFKVAIVEHSINGNILLFMDESDLEDELAISSKSTRSKIMSAIKALNDQQSSSSSSGTSGGKAAGMSFWEYRSMNKKMVDRITPLITIAPRWSISMFPQLPVHGQPASAIGGWAEWILIPEYYIFKHRESILGGLPGLIPFCIIAKFVIQAFGLTLGLLTKGLPGLLAVVFVSLFAEVGGVLAVYVYMLFWPLIPGFVNNFLFYVSVYVAPLFTVFAACVQMGNVLKK
jgi:hypothetical protein